MGRILLLARRYVAYHRGKTAILVTCLTLTVYFPVAVHGLVAGFQQQLLARAAATPLVLGAAGSRFDLILHALYFETNVAGTIPWSEVERVQASGLAVAVPLLVRYRARGVPLVGTTLDYFDLRQLHIASGATLLRLGDCVVGARLARRLGLAPGQRLLSDPDNVFDLAGTYPLNMRIVGILEAAQTVDDDVAFVDVKTAWIIAGIGHGHQDLGPAADPTAILERRGQQVIAGAALTQYTEITAGNLDSFHVHAQPQELPLTAVLAWPHDLKSGTLLAGRYPSSQAAVQILAPLDVVQQLLHMVFRIERFLDVGAVLIGLVTTLYLVLVVLLSLRLRQAEMDTMFKLGCSRWTMVWLQTAELSIVLGISLAAAGGLSWATWMFGTDLIRQMLLR